MLGFCLRRVAPNSRIHNLLVVGEKLKGIDLGQLAESSASLIKIDVLLLFKYVNRVVDDHIGAAIIDRRHAAAPTSINVGSLAR